MGSVFLKVRSIAVGLLLTLLVGVVASYAQIASSPIALWRWVDEMGRVHYTENLQDIPERYRASAVRGEFVPAQSQTPTPTPTPTPNSSGRLELLEDSYYQEEGFLHIKGKVRNGFTQSVASIKVKVSFFDADGRFLMSESTLVNPIVLAAGQVGEFHLIVKRNEAIDSYTIELTGRP